MNISEIKESLPGKTLWDKDEKGSVRGLHLKTAPSGKKSFFLYYRSRSGIQRRPKLGDVTEISLAEARRRSKAILDKVCLGSDPKAEWDVAKNEMTLLELYEKVWEEYWNKERFIKSGHAGEVRSKWNTHLGPRFGSQKLSDIKLLEIREWHKSLAETPYAANRGLEILSRLFSFAEEFEFRSPGSNPCRYVHPYKEKQRRRYATEEEAKKIFQILEREEKKNPISVAHLRLLIYTGSRPRAIERARWEDLQVFYTPEGKYGILTDSGKSTEETGEEETVVFPPQAMAVLETLPKIRGKTLTGSKLPYKLWSKIRNEAGVPDLWARDFRRLFATVGMSNGVNSGQITELLNHSSAQTTKRYAKLMHGSKVRAAMQIATKLDEFVTGPVVEGMVN